jgi:hypothetical protein
METKQKATGVIPLLFLWRLQGRARRRRGWSKPEKLCDTAMITQLSLFVRIDTIVIE